MKDIYKCFSKLRKENIDGLDYRIVLDYKSSNILIVAPHGGWIECCTIDLALEISKRGYSYYYFESLNKNKNLHITSVNYDEPNCLRMLGSHNNALTIHACNDKKERIYFGGRNELLKLNLYDALSIWDYPSELIMTRHKYLAQSKENICNKCLSGKGVQLEISLRILRQMVSNPKDATINQNKKREFYDFVEAICFGLKNYDR